MNLSHKQKAFSQHFSALSKSELNFEHFLKQDDPHRWRICELADSEKHGWINV